MVNKLVLIQPFPPLPDHFIQHALFTCSYRFLSNFLANTAMDALESNFR